MRGRKAQEMPGHFQAFLTWQSGQSVKSERTSKWLRSRTKLPLQRPPAFIAGIFARYLRHFGTMTTKLMGPDPKLFGGFVRHYRSFFKTIQAKCASDLYAEANLFLWPRAVTHSLWGCAEYGPFLICENHAFFQTSANPWRCPYRTRLCRSHASSGGRA